MLVHRRSPLSRQSRQPMTSGSRREPAKVCDRNLSQSAAADRARFPDDRRHRSDGHWVAGGHAMSRSSPRILIALAFVLGAAGCSSTKVVSLWENPQYVPEHFNRILVI